MNRIIDEVCHYKFCLILYMNDDRELNEIVRRFQDVVKYKVYLFTKYIKYAN